MGASRVSSFSTGSAGAAVPASPVMWCAPPETWCCGPGVEVEPHGWAGSSRSRRLSLWSHPCSGSGSPPCTSPPAAPPHGDHAIVAPYEAHHWCWNLGEVVKMSVRTQTSCSADSFSTLGVGALWTWGLTPLRDRHTSAVLRQSAFSPLRGTVFTAGMFVQRLKPPRKFVWIIRTCCRGYAVVGESPQTCV